MGRPGGGGGSSHSSGGHSHSSGGHYSSSHSHSSSSSSSSYSRSSVSSSRSSSSYGRSSSSYNSRPSSYSSRNYGGGYRQAPPRPVGPGYAPAPAPSRGGCGSGCGTLLAMLIVLVIIFAVIGAFSGDGTSYSTNRIDEDLVTSVSGSYLNNISDNDNAMLFYLTYFEPTDQDFEKVVVGYGIENVFRQTEDDFWTILDRDWDNTNWLGDTFVDYGNYIGNVYSATKPFDTNCFETDLDWFDSASKKRIVDSFRQFYEKTGIQPYAVARDYTKLPGVVINESKDNHAVSVFFIVVGVVVVVYIGYVWWGKKQQRKKEEAEETQRILSTPLQKFGDLESPEMDDLMSKYEDKKD